VTYSAAKAALNATVRGLARPLALEGIRINAVAPGNILSADGTWARKIAENKSAVDEMLAREVPMLRLGNPEEIADIVAFLASPRAAFITGAVIVADGGQLRA
jgi:3-oxoacyl-[acyl-carrier protein] reductase